MSATVPRETPAENSPGSAPEVQTGSVRTGNVRGGTGDPVRGSYCTPKYVADAVGPVDLDPFSNEHSHIQAAVSLSLARGEDGFGDKAPGSFLVSMEQVERLAPGLRRDLAPVGIVQATNARALLRATALTKTWIQPDYTETLLAIRHYLHTRWIALLRFDPRPEWNEIIGGAAGWIGVLSNSPGHRSFEFDFPPGVDRGAGNTFPHALYARRYEDVTPAMRALCSYPDGTARHWRKRSALDGDPSAVAAWLRSWGFDASHFATTNP